MSKFTIYDFVVADRNMVAQGGGYSFRNYTDRSGVFGTPGEVVAYNDGNKTPQGKVIGKAFTVNQSHYKLQAREGQQDYDKKPLVKYFQNAPFCLGSPNGDYVDNEGQPVLLEEIQNIAKNLEKLASGEIKQLNVKIKLMDSEGDAELALEVGLKRADAQLSVGSIDEQTLSEIAALVGVFGNPDKTMRYKVYEFAGKLPLDYFKHLNSGDRGIRALIRRGVETGILSKKGEIIFWKETILGNDENAAVSTLIADSKMVEALSDALKLKVESKSTKKKGSK